MRNWPVQEAKAKFSALLEASLNEGPQVVTKRGAVAAVLVPIREWQRLQELGPRRPVKDLLLARSAQPGVFAVPPRRKWKARKASAGYVSG